MISGPRRTGRVLRRWVHSTEFYRNYVWEEMIGKLPPPSMPPNVRTRRVLDEPAYTGYEVVIDVYPDVIAAGILLLPKNLEVTEKRPVVVCQHGLEGVPLDTDRAIRRGLSSTTNPLRPSWPIEVSLFTHRRIHIAEAIGFA